MLYLYISEKEFLLHKPEIKGLLVLVTCNYVASKPKEQHLEATEKDADEMIETFKQLQFDIHHLSNENATGDNILTTVENLNEYLKKGHVCKLKKKAIIFAFSGHGMDENNVDTIHDNDGLPITVNTIVKHLVETTLCINHIPKLFFIDACRGHGTLQSKNSIHPTMMTYLANGFGSLEGNYRIDCSTITGYRSYASSKADEGSEWMPVLARQLREKHISVQDALAAVRKQIYMPNKQERQCESLDRIETGPLYLWDDPEN